MTTDARRYVPVARLSDVPSGRLTRVEVGARLICLANVGGEISAFDDDCPHIGGPLDEGDLTGTTLTCPIHLAQFDVRSGEVLRGPARDCLALFSVRIEGDRILVALPASEDAF